MAFITTHTRSL